MADLEERVSVYPSLNDHADAGLPLQIPWMRQEIALGTGLSSALLASEKPWMPVSPFDLGSSDSKWLAYEGETEGKANFRDSESDSHLSTADHSSGSLGVTVGCPFLKANVTGNYDKTVNYNADVSNYLSTKAISVQTVNDPEFSLTRYHELQLSMQARSSSCASLLSPTLPGRCLPFQEAKNNFVSHTVTTTSQASRLVERQVRSCQSAQIRRQRSKRSRLPSQ